MLVECTILSLNILINYPFGVYLPFFLPRSVYQEKKYLFLFMVLLYTRRVYIVNTFSVFLLYFLILIV